MKKRVFIFILILLALSFVNGCKEIKCIKPYIKDNDRCCLDDNNNKICDDDERAVEENVSYGKSKYDVSNNNTQEKKIINEKIGGLYLKDIVDLIKPEETKELIDEIDKITGNSKSDILIITKELDSKINCATCTSIACINKFNTPKEALYGTTTIFDSDDYGVTLLSALKKYNPSLRCYNFILTGSKGAELKSQHLTTYCKEGNWNYLASCKNIKNSVISINDNFYYKEFINLYMIKNDYYSLKDDEKVYVIDDEWYSIYENSNELADWMMEL